MSESICGHGAGDDVGSDEVAGSGAARGEGRGGGRIGRRGSGGTRWGDKGARVAAVYILYEHDYNHRIVYERLDIIRLFGP
jgi:hypothetical protein